MKSCTPHARAPKHRDWLGHVAELMLDVHARTVDLDDEFGPKLIFGGVIDGEDYESHTKWIAGHPIDALREFCAPDDWGLIGCVANGWARELHGADCSMHDGCEARDRYRVAHVVQRDGSALTVLRSVDGRHQVMRSRGDDTEPALIDEHLRRALGRPTAVAPDSTIELWTQIWVDRLFGAAVEGTLERASWETIADLHPAHSVIDEGDPDEVIDAQAMHDHLNEHLERLAVAFSDAQTWAVLRQNTAFGFPVVAPFDASYAAWMDDGMFARCVLSHFGPIEDLLLDLYGLMPDATYVRLVDAVTVWGLLVG